MDDATFDRLTRAFVVSRRGALRAIAGGAMAGIASFAGRGDALSKPRAPKKDDPFYRVGKTCRNGELCGSLAPCTEGICFASHCRIEGETVRNGAVNPQNPCQSCRSTALNDGWQRWSDRPDGTVCPNTANDPCLSLVGLCVDGECALERFPDGTPCGENQVCCMGICCPAGMICGWNGACQPLASDPGDEDDSGEDEDPPDDEDDPPRDPDPCPSGDCESEEPVCVIGGIEHANGAPNPDQDCEFCDAIARPAGWTFVADNTACGETSDRYCCQGICCTPAKCCNQVGLCTSMADFACPELVQ